MRRLAVVVLLGMICAGTTRSEPVAASGSAYSPVIERCVSIAVGGEVKSFSVTIDPQVLGLADNVPDDAIASVLILMISKARGVKSVK